ncbi:MAG: AAA family ATPase [Chloroflexota bacterium]|nr:AAA family ATPase [Chloroflexota bacterium]
MTTERAATTTILFSDLVGSTELMQRAGDEDAQRIFKAHYQLLRDAVTANGGAEVKSLGDGLMVAFPSTADAVRCAITMQQASRRPVSGERVTIRVGINAGDALRAEGDYFGTAVVTARRLCDRAGPGQILCSAIVEGLLAGRQAFSFRDLGDLELKGLTAPVATREVTYDKEQPGLALSRTPFVGRESELSRIKAKLADARTGRGGLVMLVGEPGIGKSRMIEEFTEHARTDGAAVLFGACFEGEWVPPFAPFADAIDNYAKEAAVEALQADLGHGAGAIARLAPSVRERLPDFAEPAPLQPDEERFRLLDAVSQFLIASSQRVPVVLVLDDLHWADKGTIAMLRHVARFVTKHRILLLGAYRDVELDRQHPLSGALAQLRREVEYERIALKGLDEGDIGAMLTSLTEQDVPEAFVHAISDETDGNPFFIREVLIHLTDEGKIFQQDGRWTSNVSIAEMGIPEGVRQVIGRRLSRLSEHANKLLTAASGFNGPFHIDLAGAAAGLDEPAALDAIDEALQAQLLRSTGEADTYNFTHTLIRHTLYGELSPSRQVRLHRQIAEAMERVYGDRAKDHAAELAYQYHRSAAISGAERGVPHALAAADQAEAAAAWDEQVAFLRMSLELLPDGDRRRPRLLARLSIALMWALQPEDGVRAATDAAALIAGAEGNDAAADYLNDAKNAALSAGHTLAGRGLGTEGMRYIGDRRDGVWANLFQSDYLARSATDPDALGVGIPVDEPEFETWLRVVRGLNPDERPIALYESRDEIIKCTNTMTQPAFATLFFLGDARRALTMFRDAMTSAEREGRIAQQVSLFAFIARCLNVLGELAEARASYDQGVALTARLPGPSAHAQQLVAALAEMGIAHGGGLRASVAMVEALLQADAPDIRWARAGVLAAAARIFAQAGREDEALATLARALPAIQRTPAGEVNLPSVICDCAWALWILERTDQIDVIERNLREKVVVPDFRYPMRDGRTALARLCALQGRYDEASRWFADARRVLEEDGARPLRAIVDYDEALMYARRPADGDRERALPLLDAAMRQFGDIGMTGWTRLGEELRASLALSSGGRDR